jgi:hypothetical protein
MWGCSSIKVESDFDPKNDFSNYKTYTWYKGEMPADDALSKNPLAKKRIVATIDYVLDKKGFKIDNENPDFVVIVHAGIKERMQVNQYGGYGAYGYGRYGYGWGVAYTPVHTDVIYYDEATLVIDIADYKKKEIVWRGAATGVVDGRMSDEELDNVIEQILEDFPPHTEKK